LVIAKDSGDVFIDLVEELKALATAKESNERKAQSVMLAVDQYDSWFAETQHWYDNVRIPGKKEKN
jgi:hypothetical protein